MSEEHDYEVGFKKTPKHSRFKPGQSGNPKGRPKGRRNRGSVIRQVMERKVRIRENGKSREVPVFEVLVNSLASKAIKGSVNDQIKLIQLIEKHLPEKLEDRQREDPVITVQYVLPDGKTMADYDQEPEDWQLEQKREEVARRNRDPEVIAAWKAAGFDDEDDEAESS